MNSGDQPDKSTISAIEATTVRMPREEGPGDKIGRYKVLQTLGEGGCGTVYMAEQEEPVRRRVALKVIKLGMDTKEVIVRFEAERQALALMDHPNIAKVLDAGATGSGRPFFIMELVRGLKITDYCDENRLSTRDRLGLFVDVCNAIQHAHQKGIIHRDIKPSNILVASHDGLPVPKVIDFGIAKATQGRLTDQTLFTAFEQFIGTPAYMSPEQAELSGLDIDTRSDIYSLGVLLYELLTGKTPFDPKALLSAGLDQLRKAIREQDPPRPSTKLNTLKGDELTTTAHRRGADGVRLIHSVRGDLDWIVMKCLEKDRTRRYETANGLAMDIKRFLNNEPVLARPPSRVYRLKKTVQRHRFAYSATAAMVLCLIAGLALTLRALRDAQLARSREAEQRAFAETQRFQAQESEQRAKASESRQAQLRKRAEEQELAARLRAYASDVNLAQQALAGNNLGRAQELINRQRPQAGEQDLRAWEWRYLWRQCQSDAHFELGQQSNSILSLAVSSNGRFLAAGEQENGGVTIWDLRSRQQLTRLATNEHRIRVAFSPRGPYLAFSSLAFLASGQETNQVRLWNSETGQIETKLGLGGQCMGLQISDDGRSLIAATAAPENQITLWAIPDAMKKSTFPAPQARSVLGAPFAATPDLSVAFHRMVDARTIRAIDLHSGVELWKVPGAAESVSCLAVSPDSRILASGAGILDTAIRLFDAKSGLQIQTLPQQRGYVIGLAFTANGKVLFSASADQTIRIWDLDDLAHVPPPRLLRGHKLEAWSVAPVANNNMLASGGKDGSIYLWLLSALQSDPFKVILPDTVNLWSFSGDGKSIITVGLGGKVVRWHGDSFTNHETVLTIASNVVGRCVSADGRFIATGSQDGLIAVWDVAERRLLRELRAHRHSVGPWAFFDGGTKLSIVHEDDLSIHIWDLKIAREIPVELPKIKDMTSGDAGAFSSDSAWALLVMSNGSGWLWNTAQEHAQEFSLNLKQPADAAFSPDGKTFGVASKLSYIRLWETTTQREVATLRGFLLGIHSLAFSPDGKRLAAGSSGQEAIKLWDLASQRELLTLEGQGSVFYSSAFSTDGNALASLNSSHQLHVWTSPSWEEIKTAER